MVYGIIAAGEGSRLAAEGIKTPKPLVEIAGEKLIERLIRIFISNGATSIAVVVNEEMTSVQDYLKQMQLAVPLHIIVKSTPSSMHSFYALSPYLGNDKFCLTTVDTIFHETDFARYIAAFNASTSGMMAVTSFVDDESPLYVATNKDNVITAFEDYTPTTYISGGIYGLDHRALTILAYAMSHQVSRMRNYQRLLLTEGMPLQAFPLGKIMDIDHAADIAKAACFLAE